MHIGFVSFGFENIGVEYLSAYLKKRGHRTSLIFDPLLFKTYVLKIKKLGSFFDSRKKVVAQILSGDYGLLAFSVMTDNYTHACAIAREIKSVNPKLPIIFGGIHPTSVPEVVIGEPSVDYVCVGEGEGAIADLVDALEKNGDTTSIPNIWTKCGGRMFRNAPRPLIQNLDELPFPDKDIFYSELLGFKNGVYRINIGRGCKLSCSFCTNSLLNALYRNDGNVRRKRSVESVIEELKWAKVHFAFRHILIIDDWFTDDLTWLKEFSRHFRRDIGVSFACDAYPGALNEEIISLLEYAGCSVVSLGIQTHSERLRNDMLHRYDSNANIIRALQALRKTRIFVYVDFILGIPGQDEAELVHIADFINTYRVDFVFFLWLRYYPGTPITNWALRNNWISAAEAENIDNGVDIGSYFDRTLTYRKKAARIAGFSSVVCLLPQKVAAVMLKKKMYNFFPSNSFFYFRLMSIVVPLVKRIVEGKDGTFYFSLRENQKFYIHYIKRTLVENMHSFVRSAWNRRERGSTATIRREG